jgi:hypothetical protein
MAIATSPQRYQKEHSQHRWPDVLYVAMGVVSIAGMAYRFLKG